MKKNHTKKTQQKIVREVFERIENAVNRDEKNNIFSVYNLQAIDREKVPEIKFSISRDEIKDLTSEGFLKLENDKYTFNYKREYTIQTLHINYLRKRMTLRLKFNQNNHYSETQKNSLKNLEVTIIIRNFARSMKLFSTYWWWRTQDFKKS